MVKNAVHSQLIAGRFEIRDPEHDLLGRGSMGDVYRSTDTHTGETVAVKALDPRVVARDPGILERFVREGEALRQLDHPNIVRMVAAVEDGGRHYLVMEYVAGGSLQDLLDAQRPDRSLSVPRVLEIALDLADALTRAHRLGILHRDLKPANVLLAEDGTPRLSDFGIARVSEGPRLTQTGVLVGTPDFLSPEACEGKPIDERGDIWAFGVLLFEMLTGGTPFAGDTLTAKLSAILTQPVPDLAQRCPDAPEALVDLVYRMLEKDRQQRIPSVRLVGAELEAILKGREVPTPLRLALGESRFSTPTPDTTRPRHNLPAQPTPFVGREAELTELARLLADPDVRLLTILGAGGMGKTRLALEAGAAQLGNFERGVYFVPLAPLDSPQAIVPAVAGALGFSFYEGGEPRQQLLDYLREKNKLLIMDNFEHLLAGPEPGRRDGASLVTDILQTAPKVKILSTSRARLNVLGEHLFRLAGMDFPEPPPAAEAETPEDAADLEGRAEYSAVKLFLQSARRARPGFELEADDLRYISRICRLVGGMPLGILLAAAWLDMLTPAEIADQISGEIEASLDFLETDLRDVPERQRSLRAVFDYSWKSLTGREREVFQGLSVFRGGFTREAAQQVTGAALRELRALVNKSLLQRDPGGRYEIHELLRQYGVQQLAKVPEELETTRNQHSDYFADYLHQRESALSGKGQKQALTDIATEIENIHAAWHWATAQGRVEDIQRSLESLCEYHNIRSEFKDAVTILSSAAERLGTYLEAKQDERLRLQLARIQARQGDFLGPLGDLQKSDALIKVALTVFETLGEQRDKAYALLYLGWNASAWKERRAYFEQALTTFRKIGDRKGEAVCLDGLSSVAVVTSEFALNIQLCQESLRILQELGDDIWIARLLDDLGYAYWLVGEYETARTYHQESPAIHRQLGNRYAEAAALSLLAIDLGALEEFGQGMQLLQDALAIYEEIGAIPDVCVALHNLAEFFIATGDFVKASSHARESILYAQNHPEWFSWPYRTFGEALVGLGDLPNAKGYLRNSLTIAQSLQEKCDELLAIKAISAYFAAKGDGAKALELITLINHHPAAWQWTRDRVAPLAARLESELPSSVVAAAKERGRSRDLDSTVAGLLDELAGKEGV
jgi:predicted ATPase/predicted Ser/Thr protein kinase